MRVFRCVYSITERAPPALLLLWQKARFQRLLATARTIPFWEQRLRGVTAVDQRTPITLSTLSKADARNIFFFLRQRVEPARVWLNRTSGSTGLPLNFFRDTHEWPEQDALFLRACVWAGWKPGDAIIRTFASHGNLEPFWKSFVHDDPSDIPVVRHELYRTLGSSRPVILYSFPSFILPLADFWEFDKPNIKIRSIILTGEHLTLAAKARLERIFEAPVFLAYAAREFGIIAQECEAHRGFHVFAENIIPEIVDSEGHTVSDGTPGRMVITSLSNSVMPFIRYEIGDVGRMLTGRCPCGRTLPKIELEGREMAIFSMKNGAPLYLVEVQRIIMNIAGGAIREFQLYQAPSADLTLFIIPDAKFSPEIQHRLSWNLNRITRSHATICIKLVRKLPERDGRKRAFFSDLSDGPFTS